MSYVFSPDFKFSTWRKLWIALAETEKALGLSISDEQIAEMKGHIGDVDFERVKQLEAKTRHDVMAHIQAFGEQCPLAKPIIHWGATSAFVGDNTDLIQMKEASRLLLKRLAAAITALRDFALAHKDRSTLGFTHFQPAQLTTVGKRASLWLLELSMDFSALDEFVASLPFLGAKGATGTKLDAMVAEKMGFPRTVPVSGQTYSRKIDAQIAAILSGLAQSLHKMSNDIRLLQHLREIEEPFESQQVGSSAMAYKRNPMRCERLTSLARYIVSLSSSPVMTAAEQWFERTLDDSANKRLSIPEMFLAADASLILALNVSEGLVVYPTIIEKHLREELPFIATENILMEAVKKGGDRQQLHERIRKYSMEAQKEIKTNGGANPLLKLIADDPAFRLSQADFDRVVDARRFVGRSPEQVTEFIESVIDPLLSRGKKYGMIQRHEITV
jgi:adenylosuccinate lyase